MERLKNSVQNLSTKLSQQSTSSLSTHDLTQYGLACITPHDYQLFGINWMFDAYNIASDIGGVILGDEMGLGKTLQLLLTVGEKNLKEKVCDLKTLSSKFRCSPSLRIQSFIGLKEERQDVKDKIASQFMVKNWSNAAAPFDVLLTSYEHVAFHRKRMLSIDIGVRSQICMKEKEFIKRFEWQMLVVDEAHRLKNSSSVLYNDLLEFRIKFKALLTGTPVQNNLKEIYALLGFISPRIFPLETSDDFIQYFSSVTNEDNSSSKRKQELHALIKPFLLRRTKNEVIKDLPNKSEVLLYCGMTSEQKRLYKAILTKDLVVFTANGQKKKTSVMNILMQLRKCSNHPYIFPGIEPEPFLLGEHLIETSGKLYLLDKLLAKLKASGHKVLLFSQMTMMLDILQDYLGYRGYTYERLDGSVRGEERFLAVNNFNETTDTFIFLLSTRAGGQGLNLMSADTVIFVDNDFNPQNDLQAAARAHRIGQTRPVKIIRLVARNTVEEIILNRANHKLSLTDTVIEGGQFSNISNDDDTSLTSILKFGLDDLLNDTDDSSYKDVDFEEILGKSVDGKWISEELTIKQTDESCNDEDNKPANMYVYEGEDYSKCDASNDDNVAFDQLIQALTTSFDGERTLRKDKKSTAIYLPESTKRKRRQLTDEEKEERRKKMEENRAKRIKLIDEQKKAKLEKLWLKNNYTSYSVHLPTEESDSSSSCSDDDNNADSAIINYMVGDVTTPQHVGEKDAIVVHCVDDSGSWGSGGLFTAINTKSHEPKQQYELAYNMKDLSLGDVHLIKILDINDNSAVYVALIVAQSRDSSNRISSLLMNHLEEGLEKISHVANKTGASVHLPRIGYNTPNFNWYGTERLIKKILTQRNIPTYMNKELHKTLTSKIRYYFKRRQPISLQTTSTSIDDQQDSEEEKNVERTKEADQKKLSRYVVAYDGEIEQQITNNTTHIICTPQVKHTLKTMNTSCKFVSKAWLEDCIKHKKLLNETFYEVKEDNEEVEHES